MERNGLRGRERSGSRRVSAGAARKGIASPVPKLIDRGLDRGNGLFRKELYSSKMAIDSNCVDDFPEGKNSIGLGYRQNPCKKVSGTPIKTLINEEMSKELETRRPAPSLVARLMGLDSLPSSKVVNNPRDGMESCFSHGSSVGYQGKHASCVQHLFQKSIDENQDFKDVFEIVEMKESEESKNQSVQKVIASSQRSETDVAFIRQKFMDAKRLSTNESLQKSKEFNDALEVLDSNKDLFLKFLQEPNSLFSKHLQGLKCAPPPPHASHITILKSANGTRHRNSEVHHELGRNTERCCHMQKEDGAYLRRPGPGLINHSLREHNSPLAHKLSKPDFVGNNEVCSHATRIVVLKPSLEMTQNKAKNLFLPRSTEDIQFGYKRQRETRRVGIQELNAEGRAWQKSSDNVEVMGHRTKGSREIAREITEQMRHSMSNSCKNVANSQSNSNNREARPRRRCEVVVKPEAYQWSSGHFHYMDNDTASSSSSNSTETSVTREARKRLSERWKITKRSQQVGIMEKPPGTLGEMLSLTDREMAIKPRFIIQRDKKLAKCEAIERDGNPSGISSKDGWKEGCSKKLERSISLPNSTAFGIPKLTVTQRAAKHDGCSMLKDVLNLEPDDCSEENNNRRIFSSRRSLRNRRNKPLQLESLGAKSVVLKKEIHVNKLPKDNVDTTLISEPFDGTVPDKGHLVDDFLSPLANLSSLVANEELMNKPISCEVLKEDFSSLDQNDIKKEETSYHQTDPVLPSDHNLTELGSPVSSKEAEQPSPVSVLECPSEEISSSGCFESVSADLKELRMQLRLLKLESSNAYAEEIEPNFSDADDEQCHSLTETTEILLTFEDGDDRDFSYLLDVLSDLGVHEAEWDRLSDTCYMREYPVCSNVFESLEKKYHNVKSWSRSERKLLFDLITLVLAEIVEQVKNQHSWVKPRRVIGPMCSPDCLVEKVWQMVVKCQKESDSSVDKVLDLKYLNLVEDVDIVGIEIESMLKDELLEELVSDLILAG